MSLESVRKANPRLAMRSLDDPAFARYGRVIELEGLSGPEGLAALAGRVTGIDPAANRYVASDPVLEAHPALAGLSAVFGHVDIQVGWCNGPNSLLNGLEYHKSAEIDIAVTDLVLLLGTKDGIAPDLSYASASLECFFLPAGSAVELDAGVLHFSPCRARADGFKCVVVLPRGTNAPLSVDEAEAARAAGKGEARLLFMRNKWLLAHPERAVLVERGAYPGISGTNIEVLPGED